MWILILAIACLGYLFGSFPPGYFAGRISGVDIRSAGSGNIGATNVLRVLGKRWGYAVFLADAFKGFAAVRLTLFIAHRVPSAQPYAEYLAILAAVCAVIGHSFPVWLRFKGGKGVATSAGALFGLMPLAVVIVFLIWLIVFETTRYVSVASVIAASSLPIVVALFIRWKMIESFGFLYLSTAMTLLVIWRHRSNFSRLRSGTEQRFTRK
ncbi:MAG: acyl phosphate:glycerol-3-phosphate acyltransferase [Verrucomicrobiota bacterium]